MAVVRTPNIKHVTVVGRIWCYGEDYQRLVYLAHKYRDAVMKSVKMLAKGLGKKYTEEILTKDLNQGYAKAAVDIAELVVEGAEYHNSNPLKIKVRKLFIASKGVARLKGNGNIRLLSNDKLIVSYNFNGKSGKHNNWIQCSVKFGEEYIPLIDELIDYTLNQELSYMAKILFRSGKIYLHISTPTELYIKHFKKVDKKPEGSNIASFDLNSDRINMVIVDRQGIIRDTKTERYSEVNRPGYPKDKAWALRLQALGKLLRYAYYCGANTVLFEDLDKIKRSNEKGKINSGRNGNRKITRFPKKQLLEHGVLMAWKYGFRVYLVNPSYTSKLAEKLKNSFYLDRHTTSAYTLALRYLNPETFRKLLKKDVQKRLLLA